MLHILLFILKIIGIVLFSILCLILLLLCLALFVPVHYQLKVERTEGAENPPVEVEAKITWLFHFINVKIQYPAQMILRVRILFFTIFGYPSTKKDDKKSKKKKKREKKQEEKPQNTEKQPIKEKKSIKDESQKDDETDKYADKAVDKTTAKTSAKTAKTVVQAEREGKIWQIFIKIRQFLQKIRYTITGIYDKIKGIFENIEYYLQVLQSDTFHKSFALCKNELGEVLSYIKPRKLEAEVFVGMDDPASTGQILSYYGILYPIIGNHVTVIGDFENKRLEGNIFIKGKIKLFKFIKAGIKIGFNKDIRNLLKLFKKEDL